MTVAAGDLTQIDEVHSGRSYQSDFGKRLHFGLGKRNAVDEVRVQWIGGGVDILRVDGVNRLVTVVEGEVGSRWQRGERHRETGDRTLRGLGIGDWRIASRSAIGLRMGLLADDRLRVGDRRARSGPIGFSILLRDVTRETGITFVHTDGSSGRRYIVESVCCRVWPVRL